MTQFRIDSVSGPRQWTGTHGSFLDYDLNLSGELELVTLTQKPETPAPQYGETLEGEIVVQSGRRKFKKDWTPQPQQASSNGSQASSEESGDRQRLIVIQACTKAAAWMAAGMVSGGPVGDKQALVNWVMETADALAAHCEDYAKPTPAPSPPPSQPAPSSTDPEQTDIPVTHDDSIPF